MLTEQICREIGLQPEVTQTVLVTDRELEQADFFEQHKVADYIIKYFESMHTTSDECIISDIDELAKA